MSIARGRVALAIGALALTGGLLGAAPAHAETPHTGIQAISAQVRTAVNPARPLGWHLIWGPYSHRPTRYWATGQFVPDRDNLGVNVLCGNGGDGTQVKVKIVRTAGSKVIAESGWSYCNGQWKTLITHNARGSQAYFMRIYLKGKAHTITAKAYDYH